jgi:hypothetical protein
MTCFTKDLLVRFYGWLNFSLRTLVHYRVLATFGKPFDYFLVEEPWRVHKVLEKAVGKHNAELILHILADWLRKNGCNTTPEELRRALSDRFFWSK